VYAGAFIFVVYLTRAVSRRVVGSLFGGGIAGLLLVEIIVLGEVIGWWHWQFEFASYACFPVLLYVCCSVSCAPIYLITWRVARRFSWWGLTVVFGGAVLIGLLRDYLIARHFPEWGGFASGAAPTIAVAITYIVFLMVGHAAMQFTAGPAENDRLARQRLASRR
jgi:hypothetical protein